MTESTYLVTLKDEHGTTRHLPPAFTYKQAYTIQLALEAYIKEKQAHCEGRPDNLCEFSRSEIENAKGALERLAW